MGIILLLALLIAFNFELIVYGLGQAKGQFKVLWNAQPISEMLESEQVPDSLKQKLLLVEEIRQFAFDSLGLTRNENYTTIYDQKGQEILWVVTACEPYQFVPRVWSFPIIGSFTYKGFFDFKKAENQALELKQEGNDVNIRSVSGWSTLGWFKDPLLSNMLFDDDGDLASTIIHELTHGTLFIPDSMTFNENLASFIGTQGTIRFLSGKYGPISAVVIDYKERKLDAKKFTDHLIRGTNKLDSLYLAMEGLDNLVKETEKVSLINNIVSGLDTVKFFDKERYDQVFEKYHPNNAYFVSFLNYQERQSEFQDMLYSDFNNDIIKFVAYWKDRYEIY